MQNFEKGHFFIQESKKFFFCFHWGKDWRTKYYYEAMCRTVACILYRMKSYVVAVEVAQIFELFSINKQMIKAKWSKLNFVTHSQNQASQT